MVDKYINKIVNWDCYQLLKTLPEKSIDLIVTDPPYLLDGWGWEFKDNRPYLQKISDDSNFGGWFTNEFLLECKRVLKKFNWYFFCNKKQIKQYLDFAEENGYYFDILTWIKTNPSPLCNNTYLPDTEYIIFIKEPWVKLYTRYKTASKYWVTPVQKNNFNHPTSKPLFLMDRMIINSSKEWEIVLDPFFWTGSTGLSAKQLNRNFIGFELTKEYCDIAKERLDCEIIESTDLENLDEAISVIVEEWIVEVKDVSISVCPKCWGRLVKTKHWKTCEDCMEDY